MKKIISKNCALLGFVSCVLMLVAFIIMVLPSGVILMTLKKPEILVKTLNVRLPDTMLSMRSLRWEHLGNTNGGADSKSLCQNFQLNE